MRVEERWVDQERSAVPARHARAVERHALDNVGRLVRFQVDALHQPERAEEEGRREDRGRDQQAACSARSLPDLRALRYVRRDALGPLYFGQELSYIYRG